VDEICEISAKDDNWVGFPLGCPHLPGFGPGFGLTFREFSYLGPDQVYPNQMSFGLGLVGLPIGCLLGQPFISMMRG
jgi:hypothetical protein